MGDLSSCKKAKPRHAREHRLRGDTGSTPAAGRRAFFRQIAACFRTSACCVKHRQQQSREGASDHDVSRPLVTAPDTADELQVTVHTVPTTSCTVDMTTLAEGSTPAAGRRAFFRQIAACFRTSACCVKHRQQQSREGASDHDVSRPLVTAPDTADELQVTVHTVPTTSCTVDMTTLAEGDNDAEDTTNVAAGTSNTDQEQETEFQSRERTSDDVVKVHHRLAPDNIYNEPVIVNITALTSGTRRGSTMAQDDNDDTETANVTAYDSDTKQGHDSGHEFREKTNDPEVMGPLLAPLDNNGEEGVTTDTTSTTSSVVCTSPVIQGQEQDVGQHSGERTSDPQLIVLRQSPGDNDTTCTEPTTSEKEVVPKDEQQMDSDDTSENVKSIEEDPDQEHLNKILKQFGRHSSTVKQMCDIVCSKIKESSSDIKCIWPGQKVTGEDRSETIMFVAVTDTGDVGNKTIFGFDVLFCKENTCNDEGHIVMNSQQMKEKPFTGKELNQLQHCLSKYSSKLMSSHSNIEIVSACSVKSTHFREKDGDPDILNETCIVLYVHVKGIVPLQEETFPKQIWGFPVDVREGCFVLCVGPNDYHANLKMGCAICRDTGDKTGTLGAFIEYKGDNYCLTSAHVLLTGEELKDVKSIGGRHTYTTPTIGVHQPVRNPPQAEDRFGELLEVLYDTGGENNIGMEIAIVKIEHRKPISGDFPDGNFEHAGFNASQPMVFNSGEILSTSVFINNQDKIGSEVVKYGCTTGVTRGSFALVGTAVRTRDYSFFVDNCIVELHGQIEISKIGETRFADQGDSGALVFGIPDTMRVDLRPVGIVTGTTTYGGAIITPISAILERFGINQLKCFPGSYLESMSGINSDISHDKLDIVKELQHVKMQQQETNDTVKQVQNDVKSMQDLLAQIYANTKK